MRPVASREIIAQCCPRAARAGVRPEMTLAQARALLGTTPLEVVPSEPDRDHAALTALAQWALRLAPRVAPDPPDGLLLDVTGCQRLYGDERRLVNAIANRLAWLGFHARVAAASTCACARAVARFSHEERAVIDPGRERDILAPLPVEALALDASTLESLLEVGIETIDHLLALPRLELLTRFGSALLRRLDQATGAAPEVLEPVRPAEPLHLERAFDGPVQQLEALLLAVGDLLEEMTARLERLESGVLQLQLALDRADAPPLDHVITLSDPSRDARHLWSLLKPRLETTHMGFGIEAISLRALLVERLPHEQREAAGGSWRTGRRARDDDNARRDTAATDRAFGQLFDTLTHRLGPRRMIFLQPVQSHRPERAFLPRTRRPDRRRTPSDDEDAARVTPSDRPSLLLARPEPIDVIAVMPEGPPVWLRWRGETRRLVTAAGPERIGSEWWRAHPHARTHTHAADMNTNNNGNNDTRDYFKVQDDTGRWLWIFRDPARGRWFAHGEWA